MDDPQPPPVPITAEEVRATVERIKTAGDRDPEMSHVDQDWLYVAILRAVAEGRDNTRTMAREALEIEELGFRRWYA
jgi:hypothetical protein